MRTRLIAAVLAIAAILAVPLVGSAAAKKKPFTPKTGLYTSTDGATRLRVTKASNGKTYVRLFRTPTVSLVCTDGTKIKGQLGGLGFTAPVKGKSFAVGDANTLLQFSGSFGSTKSLKGAFTAHRQITPSKRCNSAKTSFSARRTAS